MIDPKLGCSGGVSTNHYVARRSFINANYVEAQKLRVNQIYETILLCTGSTYTGEWNYFGMHGKGVYTFPDGVAFDGRMENGRFHGPGRLTFPNGNTIAGDWEHGIGSNFQLTFADGLRFKEENWNYCRPGCRS